MEIEGAVKPVSWRLTISDRLNQVEQELTRRGLRRVWGNFHGEYALTPDHEIVFMPQYALAPPDLTAPHEPVEDRHTRRVVYIWAALRNPDLAHLMPQRSPGDLTCPHCDGLGVLKVPIPETALDQLPEGCPCWCLGLGWWPDGVCLLGFD
jgi:hypothetical protein